MNHIFRDQFPVFPNHVMEIGIRLTVELLAMAKHPDQTTRIDLEHVCFVRRELASTEDETINTFGALHALSADHFTEGNGAVVGTFEGQGEAIFDNFRNPIDRAGRTIVVLHEALHANQLIVHAVTKIPRDPGLDFEIKGISRARDEEVQLVAHTMEKFV